MLKAENRSGKLTIREAQTSDISNLTVLARETYVAAFGHSFAPDDLTAHLENHLSEANFAQRMKMDTILLAEVANRSIGYVQFGPMNAEDENNGEMELRRLYVHPECQNRGLGSALMEAALQHPDLQNAGTILLDVWEHNHGAQRFYRRYGFEVIGTRAFEVESEAETSLDLIMARRTACAE